MSDIDSKAIDAGAVIGDCYEVIEALLLVNRAPYMRIIAVIFTHWAVQCLRL